MDIASLLTALNSVDSLAEKNSPYAPFESAASGIGSALLKGAQNYSLPENVVGGLLTGLVGGYAQNLTNDYKAQQSGLARSLLEKALSGQQLDVAPEGMNPTIFNAVQNTGNIFAADQALEAAKEKRLADLQTASAIDRAKALAPIEVQTEIEKKKADLELLQKMYGGSIGGLAALPPGLQDDAIKQRGQAQQSNKIDSAIESYFEKAKGIKSLSTFNPLSTASNDMNGIQVGLTNMLQAAQGREMNDSARKDLIKMLPDWNDTEAQIEEKKALFKKMFNTILPPTPLLGGSVNVPQGITIQAPNGIGKDEAIAELKRRGLYK